MIKFIKRLNLELAIDFECMELGVYKLLPKSSYYYLALGFIFIHWEWKKCAD